MMIFTPALDASRAPRTAAFETPHTQSTRTPSQPSMDKAMDKATDKGARSYKNRAGEMAYGVPNVQFDLEGTLSEVISRARKNASDAFGEFDSMGSMDGDFDDEDF